MNNSILQWLSNLNIKARVNLNLYMILITIVIICVIGYLGIQVAQYSIFQFRSSHELVEKILEINRSVIALQRDVQEFTRTGSEGIADRVDQEIEELELNLMNAKESLTKPEQIALLDRMSSHFKGYQKTYEMAKEELRSRSALIDRDIQRIQQQFDIEVRMLEQFVKEDEQVVLRHLDQGIKVLKNNMYQYLYDPNIGLIFDAQETIQTALNEFEAISVYQEDSNYYQSAQSVYNLIKEFDQLIFRIVQSTRGYLFLNCVVMAGEAQEFNYVSNQLRQIILDDADRIDRDTDELVQTLTKYILVSALVLLLLSSLISWSIARSIIVPISAMTSAFQALVSGEDNLTIPVINRKDEIGVMAKAASLFQEKNQETKQLLDQSNQMRDELETLNVELGKSNKELETFAYAASHDLQEPLRVVRNYMDLLKRKYHENLDEKANHYIDGAVEATKRMMALINDLLMYSRVSTKGEEFVESDLNDTVAEVKKNLDVSINESNTVFQFETLPVVKADPSQMVQLIQNLCSNAIKYQSGNTPVIKITATKEQGEWCISVQDNGIGIEDKFKKRVFEIFQRLHTRSDYPGSGVGLALCKRIVERHHGRIWVESEPGNGSTFFFTLPV